MSARWILVSLACLAAACRGTGGAWTTTSSAADGIDLTFTGVENATEAELTQVVALELEGLDGRPIDKAAVDDSAYALELFYRDRGFADVYVDYEFTPGERPKASFQVSEGPLVMVESFEVGGATALSRSELDALIEPAGPGTPYSLARTRRAVGAVREAYLARGYLSVEVTGPTLERSEGRAAVRAQVVEGPRFALREIEVSGALPRLQAALERLARKQLGRAYTPHFAYKFRSTIIDRHANRGYPECSVEFQTSKDEETGDVRLSFQVDPGQRIVISEVEVVGNQEVAAHLIKRRVELEPGDTWDPEKIEESFRQLYATGLFSAVDLSLAPGEGGRRKLVAEVEESPTLEAFVEPGWGSYVGPIVTFGVDERNMFGSGRRGKLEAHLSQLDSGVQLLLADPWLFNAAVTGETSIFYHDRIEPSFAYSEVGFNLGVRKDWSREVSTTLGYQLSFTETRDVQVGGVIPPNLVNDVDIGSLTFSIVRNTRDNVILPTKGSVVRFYSNLALTGLGSEVDLFENGIDLSRVYSLDDKTQLAGTAKVSVVAPFADTLDVPLTRRLFNGGENTVRSFKQSELGPKDLSGEPIGGQARNILSIEMRRKLVGNFSAAVFYDTGNVILDYADYFDFADFRSGIGAGLRYLLPIGPLRLDYAINPDPRPDEDAWVLHFAVGFAY
jgi:outer membrane protein assembly complex protein YaeT